mmetsp:Transcript_5519/g.9120  ORF Transcript_5519/g.9120 Transcript_5519/m.9120 type:complete len:445 (-) Transcript_5519:60-1394(-)
MGPRIWMEHGDRSHPNLVKLDALALSYPDWQRDFSTAEEAQLQVHLGERRSWAFDDAYHQLVEKQRLYTGDRSHPCLIELDSLVLTYPGWQSDVGKAEKTHLSDSSGISENVLEGMRRKQQVFLGDRSHPNLVKLDALLLSYSSNLSYIGWQHDFRVAEVEHVAGKRSWAFNDAYHRLVEKQRLHADDRSHPALIELDSLVLAYPGSELDVSKAEQMHLNNYEGIPEALLESMRRKQQVFVGDRSHPNLVKLDGMVFSYPCWRPDFQIAEQEHVADKSAWAFDDAFHRLVEKQRLHNGDRSRPCLIELDSLVLTYPDWQTDVKRAEEFYVSNHDSLSKGSDFLKRLDCMKKKQTIFCQYRHKDCGHCSVFTQGSTAQKEQLTPQNTEVPPDACIICLHQPRSHTFVPCGHVCVCEACGDAALQQSGRCPLCRQDAQQVMRLYFS